MNCDHDFNLDLDGQVTCFLCGIRDDEMIIWRDPYTGITNQKDFE